MFRGVCSFGQVRFQALEAEIFFDDNVDLDLQSLKCKLCKSVRQSIKLAIAKGRKMKYR